MPSRLTVVLVSLLLATSAFIFWLLLLIMHAKVSVLCPPKCKCDTSLYLVICYDPSLTAIPLIRLIDVRILLLSGNKITSFESDSFFSVSKLKQLSVSHCGLRTIELGAFNGLTDLRFLSLDFNEISVIFPGTFQYMFSLEELDLMYNRINHLDSDMFSGLVNVKRIYLSGNKLQYLNLDPFFGLSKLKSVSFSENPGLQLQTYSNFIKSPSVSHLDISSSNVSSVSVEKIVNISALEWLDLSYNNLRTVDINILRALPNLAIILLDVNPLHCDCQLQEVWRWCEDRNIRTQNADMMPNCATPKEVEGLCWSVLEKGQCLEGNIQYDGDYKNTRYSESEFFFPIPDLRADPKIDTKQRGFFSLFSKQYQLPLHVFPFIFGSISNVILLIIIICNKDMRTVPNMYIINLAISDIIYLTVLFAESYANIISDTWLGDDLMCTFLPFCRRMSVGLSAYSVAVLSIQRYRVTVNPFYVRVSSPPTWRVTGAIICGVWILAALFAVPSALSKYQCEESAILLHITYFQLVVIFDLLVSCVLPLCVIAFTYVMTARHLEESSRSLFEGTQNPQLKTRRITARIVVGLTVVFVISYVPYHVFWTYINCTREVRVFSEKITDILIYSNYKLRYTYQIPTCFLLINSCFNPVALFCTSSPFRQHLKRYLTCFYKTHPPPSELELARRN